MPEEQEPLGLSNLIPTQETLTSGIARVMYERDVALEKGLMEMEVHNREPDEEQERESGSTDERPTDLPVDSARLAYFQSLPIIKNLGIVVAPAELRELSQSATDKASAWLDELGSHREDRAGLVARVFTIRALLQKLAKGREVEIEQALASDRDAGGLAGEIVREQFTHLRGVPEERSKIEDLGLPMDPMAWDFTRLHRGDIPQAVDENELAHLRLFATSRYVDAQMETVEERRQVLRFLEAIETMNPEYGRYPAGAMPSQD